MKVESEIVHHPKYLLLKKRVGDYSLEALVRIWGHCEQCLRGEFWRGKGAEHLEAVAGWSGAPGELFSALVDTGWVKTCPNGIRIHDWETHNWRRVLNWSLGKRPKKTKSIQGSSQSEATDKPRLSQGSATAKPEGKPSDMNDLNELSTVQGKKNGARTSGAGPDQNASLQASRTRFAALRDLLARHPGREADASAEERREYREKKRELDALQKKQAAGDFES